MKKRISGVANFFAFNLLFFALYLNFIHQDSNTPAQSAVPASTIKGTVLVKNSAQYLQKIESRKVATGESVPQDNASAPLKLSFN